MLAMSIGKRIFQLIALAGLLAAHSGYSQAVPEIERSVRPPAPSVDAARRESILKLAVATHPDSAAAWTNLGWHLYKNDEFPECYTAMAHARELSPEDPYVIWLSGLAAFSIKRYSEAADLLWPLYRDYAVPARPTEYREYEVQVVSPQYGYVELDSPLPSKPPLPSIIEGPALYDILGRSLLCRGDLQGACTVLVSACALAPNDWHPYFFLGYAECLRAKGNPDFYEAAVVALEKARSIAPSEPLVDRFYAFARAKCQLRFASDVDRKATSAALRQAIAAEPREPLNYQVLAQLELADSNIAAAVKAARRAVELNQNDAFSLYLLAKALLKQNTGDARNEARELLKRSIAIKPDLMDGELSAPHASLLVSILLDAGEIEQAEALTNWCLQNRIGQ